MNESIMKSIGKAIGVNDLPEAEMPDVESSEPGSYSYQRPLAPAPAMPRASAHCAALRAAVDSLPLRTVVAIRAAARMTDGVEQWAAVEEAIDAFVSKHD